MFYSVCEELASENNVFCNIFREVSFQHLVFYTVSREVGFGNPMFYNVSGDVAFDNLMVYKMFKDVAFENLMFYNVCESVPGLELLAAHSDHGWSCLQLQPWRGYMQALSIEGNGNIHILRRHRIGHINMANMLNISMGRCLHLCPWRQVHITPHAWQEFLKSMPLDGKERDYLHFRNGWTYPWVELLAALVIKGYRYCLTYQLWSCLQLWPRR